MEVALEGPRDLMGQAPGLRCSVFMPQACHSLAVRAELGATQRKLPHSPTLYPPALASGPFQIHETHLKLEPLTFLPTGKENREAASLGSMKMGWRCAKWHSSNFRKTPPVENTGLHKERKSLQFAGAWAHMKNTFSLFKSLYKIIDSL